jgi:hypothetical protein
MERVIMSRSTNNIVVPFKIAHLSDTDYNRCIDPLYKSAGEKRIKGKEIEEWYLIWICVEREYQGQIIFIDVAFKLPLDVVKMADAVIWNEDDALTYEEIDVILEKYPKVYLVNESPYMSIGKIDECVFADTKENLELFCKDIKIQGTILENAIVSKTL